MGDRWKRTGPKIWFCIRTSKLHSAVVLLEWQHQRNLWSSRFLHTKINGANPYGSPVPDDTFSFQIFWSSGPTNTYAHYIHVFLCFRTIYLVSFHLVACRTFDLYWNWQTNSMCSYLARDLQHLALTQNRWMTSKVKCQGRDLRPSFACRVMVKDTVYSWMYAGGNCTPPGVQWCL